MRANPLDAEGNRLGLDLDGCGLKAPKVPVIRWFSIENDCVRYPDASATKTILESFPHLEGITCALQVFQWFLEGHSANTALFASLPRGVKTISVMEFLEFDSMHFTPSIAIHRRSESKAVAQSAREASRQAESFAVSYIVDAELFFEPYYQIRFSLINEQNSWANLRYLALTSYALNERPDERANQLILAAANAATLMPKLELMELWNAGKWRRTSILGHCEFIFRFEVTEGLATIDVETSRGFNLSTDASTAWEQLAIKRTQRRPVSRLISPCYFPPKPNERAHLTKQLKLNKLIIQKAPFI